MSGEEWTKKVDSKSMLYDLEWRDVFLCKPPAMREEAKLG